MPSRRNPTRSRGGPERANTGRHRVASLQPDQDSQRPHHDSGSDVNLVLDPVQQFARHAHDAAQTLHRVLIQKVETDVDRLAGACDHTLDQGHEFRRRTPVADAYAALVRPWR